MEKRVKIYHKDDPQQYEDEKEYWKSKTPAERIEAVEILRVQYYKLKKDAPKRLQRVYRIIEREQR